MKIKIKAVLLRFYWGLTHFGIDPRMTVRSLRGLPRYLRDLLRYRSNYDGYFKIKPCLYDWYEESGTTKNEYFWQDLLVARKIFAAKPDKHVDIGSRVDGFVAHVASFREIEVFDVRSISAQIPGVIFKQADFMKPVEEMDGYCDSLSCLHALEHFGLGRYGDPIDVKGFDCGLVNMATLLKKGGVLYLSVPIGIDRVEFNANRVFDPRVIINLALINFLHLSNLTVIHLGNSIEVIASDESQLAALASQEYALGIFTFEKKTESCHIFQNE